MSDLFYINEEGNNVHTAQFLRNRGSCCKTNCLHCPYGTTLKNFGLDFKQLELSDLKEGNDIIKEASPQSEETLGESLLQEAFGKSKKTEISKFNFKDFYFVLLKDQKAGLVKKGRLQLKELFLKKHFQDQELDLPTVASFFPN